MFETDGVRESLKRRVSHQEPCRRCVGSPPPVFTSQISGSGLHTVPQGLPGVRGDPDANPCSR